MIGIGCHTLASLNREKAERWTIKWYLFHILVDFLRYFFGGYHFYVTIVMQTGMMGNYWVAK